MRDCRDQWFNGGISLGNGLLVSLQLPRRGRPGLEGGAIARREVRQDQFLGRVAGRGGDRRKKLGHHLGVLGERGVVPPQHEVFFMAAQHQHADRLVFILQSIECLFEVVHLFT